jgi:hypothetical protein
LVTLRFERLRLVVPALSAKFRFVTATRMTLVPTVPGGAPGATGPVRFFRRQ